MSFSFQAGDTISAEVTFERHSSSGYGYNFDLIDETTGDSFDVTKNIAKNDARYCGMDRRVPSLGNTIQNLANFGSVTFSNDMAA